MFGASRSAAAGSIPQLCRQNNWIPSQEGDNFIIAFQGDPITPQRSVFVGNEDSGRLMIFLCPSRARFSIRAIPHTVMPALLMRNKGCFGTWYAAEHGDDIVFACRHSALAGGMDAAGFRFVCTQLLQEVAEVEQSLRRQGWL